jgi:UDP-2,3-diacylglucosamine hydrolase
MAHDRHLFISDLHLDFTAPEAVAQFLRFLDEQARDCAGLYILGDLVETWIGDDDDEPVRGTIGAALRTLTRQGTPCWIMRGNRDFLLGEDFEQRTGCQLLPDPALLEMGQLRVVLTHGDLLCTGDVRYQQFRLLAHSPRFRQVYLRLPLTTRRALAHMGRSRSHEHTRQTRTDIMDVSEAAVVAALRCANSNLLIHGHTHRPGIHPLMVDGQPATRIVLGDWYEQGSCLALYPDGRYERLELPRAATGSTVNMESNRLRV